MNYIGTWGSEAGTGPIGYYRCRQIILTNLGKRRLTRHRSALPANPTSSRPRSWSLGNATLVVAERSGWRRVLGASKPKPSAKGAHRYRKWACLEALRLATTKLTQRGTGYPSWGHPTQLRIFKGSTGLIQLKDRRSVGAISCNSGDGTDQRVQSLMFMMMMTSVHYSVLVLSILTPILLMIQFITYLSIRRVTYFDKCT